MNNRDPDEGLTPRDYDNREWHPRDFILALIAVIVTAFLLGWICSGCPKLDLL